MMRSHSDGIAFAYQSQSKRNALAMLFIIIIKLSRRIPSLLRLQSHTRGCLDPGKEGVFS